MNILDRYKKPTPKFFRILRTLGVGLATAGGTILAAPVSIPAWLISIATYVVVAGTVVTAVSQAAVDDDNEEQASKVNDDGN
ncbi:hypothetical protein [Aequorivita viscosa]|uniref:Holin n=1 Tax=Aequorivita viscosa TaxID=797419 RepID=A0A1M6KFZ6_9FLAO|nr:hypothetical protein [Aequorivita viscosa]SDX20364.1 hypothetical protein SAMN05216556_12044 [Aequorivita viscosa]SHJ57886.1 hypothetical protein SAMN04487908_12029 [Aequorivita viscosa]